MIERLAKAAPWTRRQYEKSPQSVLMTEIVPRGYISVREAGNRLDPELFPVKSTRRVED
jgi:hypothetical protein